MVQFLRDRQHRLVCPEVLGLPATAGRTHRVIDRAAHQFCDQLLAGDEQSCREITLDLYLAGHSITRICDQVIAKALHRIGDRWERGEVEVYQERRGCEISVRVLHELRSLVTAAPSPAPLALGGAPEGDPYCLPVTMVELVLRDNQWQSVLLGNDLPFYTLKAAIQDRRPRLFWLSVSHVEDEAAFLKSYEQLHRSAGPHVAFAVGGRALSDSLRQQMTYAAFCDTLQHLESFACTLRDTSPSA
jgi:methanogenic corrinoid protein MtbC1